MDEINCILFKSDRSFIVRNTCVIGVAVGCICFLFSSTVYAAMIVASVFVFGYLCDIFFSSVPSKVWISGEKKEVVIEFFKYYSRKTSKTYSVSNLTWDFEKEHIGRGMKSKVFVIRYESQPVLKILPEYTGWSRNQLVNLSQQLSTIQQMSK